MQEILVIDDERTIREGLKLLLEGEGYAVRLARNGEAAVAEARTHLPDLVLLDVMMPGMSGFRVCELLREINSSLPIVFLTARVSEGDQVRAFGLGGDDYVFKTAPDSVLLARIRRFLSRDRGPGKDEAPADAPRRIRLGTLTVDFDGMTIDGNRKSTPLTKAEADFLWLLNTAPGTFFSVDEIAEVVNGANSEAGINTVYMTAYRLKRKLGRYGNLVASARSAGYKLIL